MESITSVQLYNIFVDVETNSTIHELYTKYYSVTSSAFSKLINYMNEYSDKVPDNTKKIIIGMNEIFQKDALVNGIYRRDLRDLHNVYQFVLGIISKEMCIEDISTYSNFLTIISTAITRLNTSAIYLQQSASILSDTPSSTNIQLDELTVDEEKLEKLRVLHEKMTHNEKLID